MADFLLTVGADVELSYSGMKKDIASLISKINGDQYKIKVAFDFDIDKAAADKLKAQIDSASIQRVTQASKSANTQFSSMVSRLRTVNTALKEIQATNNSIATTYRNLKNALSGEAAAGQNVSDLDALKAKYLELQSAVERLRISKSTATQDDINNIYRLQTETQGLITTIQGRITVERQIATTAKQAAEAEVDATKQVVGVRVEEASQTSATEQVEKRYYSTLNRLKSALNNYTAAEKSKNATSRDSYTKIQSEVEALEAAFIAYRNNSTSIEDFKLAVASANTTLASNTGIIRANGDATKTLLERMGGLASKFGSWLTVSQAIMFTVRAARQMITTTIELDDKMTQMQIVTKASAKQMNEFADSAAEAAQKVGSSISDFVDSATTYARLGYNLDESSQLAKYTAMLQNVGDIDVGDAQNAITSIIKAFNITDFNQIESVMDKLVTTGNGFPISVSQIAEGMTNASSALSAAGNSFEQSVALLTAANTTVQNASKSSTGLRTIAARIRNTKAELDDLGETMTEASYEKLVQMLTDCNVALTDVNGEYRSTYDIMADIAAEWENMTSMEQAALATALSGTRQQAVFFSIIEQFQEASGAMDAMSDSAGALNEAYSVYMDSTTAHINQFKAAFQELSSDLFDSDELKFFIDSGTTILSTLTQIVDTVGTLPTLLGVVAGAMSFKDFGREKKYSLIILNMPKAI